METNSTTLTAKLPILNPGDFDLWLTRIEQYFLMTDYSLWDVILNGNKVLKKMVAEVEQTYEPTSVEENQDRKNEMKARGTLLMALPNKDQIKFHQYKDAKLLMEAIKKSLETIDQTFDSLQNLIGQLETECEVIEQEDMNLKLLRSSSSTSQNPQNVAFGSSNSTNSTNSIKESDNTAYEINTTHTQGNVVNTINHIDPDDLEEIDLQWEMAMLTIRARSYQAEEENPTNFALMAYTSSGSSSNLDSEENKISKLDKGYHDVPPPITRNFMPPNLDLMFSDEIVESESLDVTTIVTPENTVKMNSSSPPIIEDWNSDDENEVNTVRDKDTTARHRAVVNGNKGKGINAIKALACWVWRAKNSRKPQQMKYKEKEIIDSGYSRHMTGNKYYYIEYEDYEGGFVSFGDGKGRITGKGKIKTGTLDFDDVYFCKELKYNMFSVSQMCDKRNNVLFTDTKCIILSSNFKLLNESQVLLRVPRKDNIYSVDLKSIIPTGGLTCLLAKATIDESNLWHRRLGHINFKNINNMVKGNLVRCLPSKIFENNYTCVAYQKGKQHKASYKAKLVNSISRPLHMLHMDLFGPTNVKSLMKKSYCLVVTDDYSRFSWVFFLATKDETSGILKTFKTGIENQLDHKVKVIRYDNGTEFKNSVMNEFCEIKGIKREFSVARTPQQNGVAARKNITLIKVARTMLVDSKMPTTFWAEAVNTACYVLNKFLITKPHNKTPYELIHRRPPLTDFMKPFGCPVTILNTRDYLGKFEGKADEGFSLYTLCFLENIPNVKGNGPDWIFDVDSLTISMNYVPVMAENQTNIIAGVKDNIIAGQVEKKKEFVQEYILIPFCTTDPFISKGPKASEVDAGEEHTKEGTSEASDDCGQDNQVIRNDFEKVDENVVIGCSHDPNIPELEDTGIFDGAYDDEDFAAEGDMTNLEDYMPENLPRGKWPIGTKWVFRNKKDERGIVVKNKARLVAQGHTQEEGIDYDEVFAPVARIDAIRLFLAYASYKDFVVHQMDVKSAFLYGKIEDEVYVWGQIDKTLFIKRHKDDILLVQVYVDYIIFGSTKKKLSIQFEKLMHDKFQMSSMGELYFFLGLQFQQKSNGIFMSQDKYVAEILKKFDFATVKTASTLMDPNKALIKDEEAEDIDVHVYRSMIGSLMYLTASRPDITFVVCACARFQVTQNTSHLHAVKRIFRYLKGQPRLGFWYPKDSPFDLKAFFDSDYVGASLDRKYTTGVVNFLARVLHSKTKHIETRHHFISDSYKKKLIQIDDSNGLYEIKVNAGSLRVSVVGRDTKVPQSSGPPTKVGDEAIHKEWGDRIERVAITASSLEAEQDNEAQTRSEKKSRKNEMKARGTLLMALPNKDQIKFHQYKDAKLFMEAIKKRLQNLIGQLETQGEVIEQKDMNLKLLRSLPSEWKAHALIWRNKKERETISLDDFTNSTNSIKEADNTAYGINTTHTQGNAVNTTNVDNLREMDLQWEMTMLTIRARRFIKRTDRKLDMNGQRIGFDRSKIECYNCHKNGHFIRECRASRNQENKGREFERRSVTVETPTENALIAQDGLGGESLDVTTIVTPENTVKMNSSSPPIIEDWNSDDENEGNPQQMEYKEK
ncbi:putative ribonuclease H-like domain-containing protein [Tanacetum coccineum]